MSQEAAWALAISQIVAGLFSAYVASEKRRNGWVWLLAGLIFGLFALVAVAGVPALAQTSEATAGEGIAKEREPVPWNPLAGPPPT